jgi:MYXO-CTERM domain-containing protein
MSNLATGKDSLAGKWKGRLGWAALAAAAALAIAGLSLSTASAHVDPGTYTGDIEAAGADCGGGTISVTTTADGAAIASVTVTGVNANGETLSGTTTITGDSVPIDDATGGFATYFDVSGHEVGVSGTFDDAGNLAGGVDVADVLCSTTYSAVAAATVVPTALPSTGTGTTTGSGSAPWPLLGAALALLGLGAGTVLLRRRAS